MRLLIESFFVDETPDNYTPGSASPEDRIKRHLKYRPLLEWVVIVIVLVPSAFTIHGIYVKGYERHWQAFIPPHAVGRIIWSYFMALQVGGLRRLFGRIDTWLGWSNPHSVAGGMQRWESPNGLWTRVSSLSWQHIGLYGLLCLSPILLLPWSEYPATDEDYNDMLWTIFSLVVMALPFFAVSVAIARGAYDICIDGKTGIISIPQEEGILTLIAIYRLLAAPPRVIPLSSVRAFADGGERLQNITDHYFLRLSLTNGWSEPVVVYGGDFHLMNSVRLVSLVAWLNENLEQARSINSSFIEQEIEESLH